jgi:hypothetical protein
LESEEKRMKARELLKWPVLAGLVLPLLFAGNAWAALSISSASWSSSSHTLTVSGSGAASGARVYIKYADNPQTTIGSTRASRSGSWTFTKSNPNPVPCAVVATSGGTTTAGFPVSGAPSSCPGGGGGATGKSINSTSTNRSSKLAVAVTERGSVSGGNYAVLAINDLGMHCGDLDTRLASVLPPFNVLHAQVIQKGSQPNILTDSNVSVFYSAASSSNDPVFSKAQPTGYDVTGTTTRNQFVSFTGVYKTNWWDDALNLGAYNPFYPFNLTFIPLGRGLPVPDPAELPTLVAAQQDMPGFGAAYTQNNAKAFGRFDTGFPFFGNFPFGYQISGVNWFSADGIPVTTFDDQGRVNAYPLMRVEARQGNTVLATLDTVAPVSGEADCRNCHTDGNTGNGPLAGNGTATSPLSQNGLPVANAFDNDPDYGHVPLAVSVEYAADLNLLRLHDLTVMAIDSPPQSMKNACQPTLPHP